MTEFSLQGKGAFKAGVVAGSSDMLSRWAWFVSTALMVTAGTIGVPISSQAEDGKMGVRVESSGDDGLTQILVASLEKTLAASARFASASRKGDSMRWILPGHLYWRDVGPRTNFHYVIVIVGPASKFLGTVDGSCWADEMDICSKKIVADVAAVAG